jgi:hypothetical protein
MDMSIGNSSGITERYLSGANASDLTVKGDREGAVDALVQVAWGRGRVGHALLRLHSEFDGAARRGLKPEQVFGQLKSLPDVRTAMLNWATEQRVDQPEGFVLAILAWWLDKACKSCGGTMWVTRPNKPKQPCTHCHGGEARIPHGNDGRGMVNFMESCMHRHRASVKGRMAAPATGTWRQQLRKDGR